MKTLGFDPSLTNFGWSLCDINAHGLDRCPGRGRFQTSSKTLFIDRYCDLRQRLLDLMAAHHIQHVGCEYPVFGDLYSEGMYGLFLYTCEAMRLAGVNVVFFSPGQLKAHARASLGRPKVGGKLWKMQKGDMVDAAREDTGGAGVWNHNEADAYWAARAGARFWQYVSGELTGSDLTVAERKQFASVHTYKRGKNQGKTVHSGLAYREDERFFRWAHGDTEDILIED